MYCKICGCRTKSAQICTKCEENGKRITISDYEKVLQQQCEAAAGLETKKPTIQELCDQLSWNATQQAGKTPVQDQSGQDRQNTSNRINRHRRKNAILVAILALICIFIIPGVYFAYPYLEDAVMPQRQVQTALKKAGQQLENTMDEMLSSSVNWSKTAQNQWTGTMELNQAVLDGNDYFSQLKANTVSFTVWMDAPTGTLSAKADILSDTGESVLDGTACIEDKTAYLKVPQLFTQSLSIPISKISQLSGVDQTNSYREGSFIYEQLGSYTSQQYATAFRYLLKDMMSGAQVMFQNSEIVKETDTTLQTTDAQVPVSVYRMNLSKDTFEKGIQSAVEDMYNDSELTSYLSLMASLTGYSKEDIVNMVSGVFNDVENVSFLFYIDENDQLLQVDAVSQNAQGENNGTISIGMFGQDNPFSYLVVHCDTSQLQLNAIYDSSQSTKQLQVQQLAINTQVAGYQIQAAVSGNLTISTQLDGQLSKKDFEGAISIPTMTSVQEDSLYDQFQANKSLFKKIVNQS